MIELIFVGTSVVATLYLTHFGLPFLNAILAVIGLDLVFILCVWSYLLLTVKDDHEIWEKAKTELKEIWDGYKNFFKNL